MIFRRVNLSVLVICILLSAVSVDVQAGVPCRKRKRLKITAVEWSMIRVDSTIVPVEGNTVGRIINKYKPRVDSLGIVVGYTKRELIKSAPESPLSNLAADILLHSANEFLQRSSSGSVDIGLLNFGGIRAGLREGAVSVSDIYSVFPFDNRIVIVELKGRYVREIFEGFIKTSHVQPVAGVKFLVRGDGSYNLLIGDNPVDDNKLYRLATVDFILNGGDKIFALREGENVIETGVLIRDAVIEYFKQKHSKGEMVDCDIDGRVVVGN